MPVEAVELAVGRRAGAVPALNMAARSGYLLSGTRGASTGTFQAGLSEWGCLSGALLYRFKRVLMR